MRLPEHRRRYAWTDVPVSAGRRGVEGGDRLVPGAVNRDRKLEAGDLENAADLVVLAAENQGAAALAAGAAVEALPGTDDESDSGGIDELAAREIDQYRTLAALECLLERPVEVGGGAEIQLSLHGNGANSLFELADLYLEGGGVHGSMLPQEAEVAVLGFV